MKRIFRTHKMPIHNGREVRIGNDPRCITGYHLLWHGFKLQGDKDQHDTDISAAPLDAPDHLPAGCCKAFETEFSICADQATVWRD